MTVEPTSCQTNPIAVTLGDPAGIGPEIFAEAWLELPEIRQKQLVAFAGVPLLERAFSTLGKTLPSSLRTQNVEGNFGDFLVGSPTPSSNRFQVQALLQATKEVLAGNFSALVTAPIHKANASKGGFTHPGHTEFLASAAGKQPNEVAMSFFGRRFNIVLATTHIALSDVSQNLSSELIVRKANLAIDALTRKLINECLRVAILGLNPHAGEKGAFGNEEADVIAPAVAALQDQYAHNKNVQIVGPLPADTAFREPFDLFVAMYHDQALIPVKLVDFQFAVNVTLGLPFIRTSPDHGVAYSLAGTGKADATPMHSAISMAFDLI